MILPVIVELFRVTGAGPDTMDIDRSSKYCTSRYISALDSIFVLSRDPDIVYTISLLISTVSQLTSLLIIRILLGPMPFSVLSYHVSHVAAERCLKIKL